MLQSVGSVGDAYDNAMTESFVDSFKTELIADRIWQTKTQLELAIVEYIDWFNHDRLHSQLGDLPPVDFEALGVALRSPSVHMTSNENQLTRSPSNPVRLSP